MLYIGVDLGTSAVKLLLMTERGEILRILSREYPLDFPAPNWSQQNPEDWKKAILAGIPALLEGFDSNQVEGIGVAGQMHGLVILDDDDRVIRPAILWNDGRTQEETDYLNQTIGKETLSEYTANIAFAGFTAPKLLWLKKNEPENFSRIRRIMLPKDYVNYILTGVHCTDYSDASGMLLLDVKNRRWSSEMLDLCGIREDQMPKLFESYEPVGTLLPEMANVLGLPASVIVAAGAGDNAAAAIGTGTIGDGSCNISLGTSGTIFISSDQFRVDPYNALHSFDHADGSYHLMACMLSAASCNKWFAEDILRTKDFSSEQKQIDPEALGRNRVFFLPYLMGERSPLNDVNARAAFLGMSMDTSRADMTQAVLEGVAFAIRDSFEVAKALGLHITKSTVCGGGAKSPLWKTILANVLNLTLYTPASEQGPGMGSAMLAMVACGTYKTVAEVCRALVRTEGVVQPEPALVARYESRYAAFRKIYPACKEIFPALNCT